MSYETLLEVYADIHLDVKLGNSKVIREAVLKGLIGVEEPVSVFLLVHHFHEVAVCLTAISSHHGIDDLVQLVGLGD